MKRILAALALLLSVSASSPSYAIAIIAGTDTGGALGHGSTTSGTTVVVTTTAAAAPGSLIVAMPAVSAAQNYTGCVDSASNTYTAAFAVTANGTSSIRMFYTIATNNLPSGGTVTCTGNAGTGPKTAVVAAFSGVTGTPLDASSVSATSASATTFTTGPTGTLTYPGGTNGEVLLGYVAATLSNGTLTNDPSFTDLGVFLTAGGTQSRSMFGYKIVSSSTPVTYAPTGSVASTFAGNLGAFIGNGTGTAVVHTLSSMGAGK